MPKQKITKEMVVNAAFELARDGGMEKVMVKNIANKLSCSVQPVYTYCNNMAGLLQDVTVKADEFVKKYISANMLVMTVAIVEAEQDFSYAELHWSHLCLWANYLEEKMKGEVLPSIELLDANDKRVKCVLGLMAYHKLIQLKDAYE